MWAQLKEYTVRYRTIQYCTITVPYGTGYRYRFFPPNMLRQRTVHYRAVLYLILFYHVTTLFALELIVSLQTLDDCRHAQGMEWILWWLWSFCWWWQGVAATASGGSSDIWLSGENNARGSSEVRPMLLPLIAQRLLCEAPKKLKMANKMGCCFC